MGFFRQEYWSGLPCPPSGDLPDLGIEPTSLPSPALAGSFFTTSTTWEAPVPREVRGSCHGHVVIQCQNQDWNPRCLTPNELLFLFYDCNTCLLFLKCQTCAKYSSCTISFHAQDDTEMGPKVVIIFQMRRLRSIKVIWPNTKECSTLLMSGKCKSQWNITSHLSEWLSSKRTQITNVGEDMEKREPLYTIGGNVHWDSHCGKQYRKTLKS